MALNIERVPDQAGKPVCSSGKAWRDGFGFRKETVASLSLFPKHVVEDAIVRTRGHT